MFHDHQTKIKYIIFYLSILIVSYLLRRHRTQAGGWGRMVKEENFHRYPHITVTRPTPSCLLDS